MFITLWKMKHKLIAIPMSKRGMFKLNVNVNHPRCLEDVLKISLNFYSTLRTIKQLQFFHADIRGPIKPSYVQTQNEFSIKSLRTNNEGEFTFMEFNKSYEANNIYCFIMFPYSTIK
ncbi:hypothetical protein CR513_40156, partial [Mucuna pruriens]